MRPPAPVPVIWLRSTEFSRASLRTKGDRGPAGSAGASGSGAGSGGTACACPPALGASAGAGGLAAGAGGEATGAAGAVAGGGAGAAAGFAWAFGPAPLPPSSILATTVLMPTVLPSSTRISESVPAAGDGISVSTLSVEISKSGSSRSTRSPAFLSHLVSVPSTMLSPIWGITTSVIKLLLPFPPAPAPSSRARKFFQNAWQLRAPLRPDARTRPAPPWTSRAT